MCPSFQITGDEVHSTRGRARILSEMLRGESIADGFDSGEARDALDLCLSCRACAGECPVGVDMATYKAEFLHHHYLGRLRPRAHLLLGNLPRLLRILHAIPGAGRLAGAVTRPRWIQRALLAGGGLDSSRSLIGFEPNRCSASIQGSRNGGTRRPVVLWLDTFTEHLANGPGTAAATVLEFLGHPVIIPDRRPCCGITYHSTGQLDMARAELRRAVGILARYPEAGLPIIGLEPSCTGMLRETLTELLPGDARAQAVSRAVTSFSEFLVDAHFTDGAAPPWWPFRRMALNAVGQTHCHERAAVRGHTATTALLRSIGINEDSVETGCCGLAGNWGFEAGHAQMSLALAERELAPKVRNRGTGDLVLADGFSCRTQIRETTGERALHIAEVLALAIPVENVQRGTQ